MTRPPMKSAPKLAPTSTATQEDVMSETNDDTRARVPRAEQETEQRRKRTTTATDPTLRRFGLSEEDVDTDKYVYRSVIGEPLRLKQLTEEDDYDFFTIKGAKAKQDGEGVLRYQSGVNVDGSPQYSYLLRKLKKFADEDRAQAVAKVDAEEQSRLRRAPSDAPDKSYTPKR